MNTDKKHVYLPKTPGSFESCLRCNGHHNLPIHKMICKLCKLDHYTKTIYPQSMLSHSPQYDNYDYYVPLYL